jgi:hypothetical protein
MVILLSQISTQAAKAWERTRSVPVNVKLCILFSYSTYSTLWVKRHFNLGNLLPRYLGLVPEQLHSHGVVVRLRFSGSPPPQKKGDVQKS